MITLCSTGFKLAHGDIQHIFLFETLVVFERRSTFYVTRKAYLHTIALRRRDDYNVTYLNFEYSERGKQERDLVYTELKRSLISFALKYATLLDINKRNVTDAFCG